MAVVSGALGGREQSERESRRGRAGRESLSLRKGNGSGGDLLGIGRQGKLHGAASLLPGRRQLKLCRNPPRIWGFSGNVQNRTVVALFGNPNLLKQITEISSDLPTNC
jgi:hypothetical protein